VNKEIADAVRLVTDVQNEIRRVREIEEQIRRLTFEAERILDKAQEKCTHLVWKEDSTYYDGNYLDRASTTTYRTCSICGKELKVEIEEHSWYG